ncbi:MAG TPA: polysaccharide deacetylase family protein [Steroidobacteraceae bacterium]
MHSLKQLIRRSIASALYYTGALYLYARVVARNRVVVLTYHRVLPSDKAAASFSSSAIIVTPDTFAMHMETVARWFKPLNAGTFAGHSGGRACLVTFDDGWYDNHVYALPVLERTRVPMLLFVATNYIGTSDCFWQETLAAHLYAARGPRGNGEAKLVFDELGARELGHLDGDEARRAALAAVARVKARKLNPAHLLQRLREAVPATAKSASPEDRFLTHAELKKLMASPCITLGSHSMTHSRLPLESDAVIEAELEGSRDILIEWTGKRPATLAYPNGDHDERVVAAARAAGYRVAFTTETGPHVPGSDLLRVRRFNMHEAAVNTKPLFLSRLLGVL